MLPARLHRHDRLDQVQVLDPLDLHPSPVPDRDVDVLADRPQASLHPPRRPEDHPEPTGDLPGVRGGDYVGRGADLDEGYPQPVEGVDDLVAPILDDPGRLLLKADRLHPDPPARGVDRAVRGEVGSPLGSPRCWSRR